jgi:hypothetical protein
LRLNVIGAGGRALCNISRATRVTPRSVDRRLSEFFAIRPENREVPDRARPLRRK